MNTVVAKPWAAVRRTVAYKEVIKALWKTNPISKQILGICSALAVTVQMQTAVAMGLALTTVVAFSSLIVSLLRASIPRNIRIIVQVAVIATLVIIADELLKAFLYDVSKQLSVFVGLIVTNCIVLGRTEAYAMNNPPGRAFLDGLANGLGYTSVLVGVAFLRELFGSGRVLGYPVIPEAFYQAGYVNNGLLVLAPGAFIMIGLFVWLEHTLLERK
ncbi:MAG TPA: NADH:ubiquinone reductase (Na(+)-transporting) subunit D [Desulfobacterales bacterium]|jgi:Na+-transporting NADH:ubiquinone oxidoreductase subunit D|nr:NADH:ubiquinone reductase (Na(+)-transporting) subunit D [Desulfobacterales bacterium]HSM90466.1 NADH:ubiquinone reductase (Na(+)-transporting) subunit D [Desulfobacterales bacterium]